MAKTNKKILTEDAFNANGNATINENVLNEDKKQNDKKEEEDKIETLNVEETVNTDEVEENVSNENINESLHLNSHKTIIHNGFDDESFYR